MRTKRILYLAGLMLAGFAVYLATWLSGLSAQQPAGDVVKIDSDDIGGVVSSTKGPEAGVWVIAETTDLPKANYTVWARGYGLVDSPKIQTQPGKLVNLKPSVAPDVKAASQYYPANYWYSMLKVPEKTDFPGTGPTGNGVAPTVRNQGQWIHLIKTDSCESCHQLGNE